MKDDVATLSAEPAGFLERLKKRFKKGEIKTDHKPVASDRAERTAQRTNRVLVFAVIGLSFVTIVQASAIAVLSDLKEMVPLPIQVEGKAFYKILPIYSDKQAETLAKEAFVRRYVLERETLNLVDETARWTWVQRVSHANVWNPFHRKMKDDKVYEEALNSDITRHIEINDSAQMRDNTDQWIVDYTLHQYRTGERVGKPTKHRAVFQLGKLADKNQPSKAELWDNPLRLRVDAYTPSEDIKKTEVTK